MPALRLKTKLVFAITAMVVAIVATLAGLYISEVVKQRIQETYDVAFLVGNEIYAVARPSLEVDLTSTRIDLNDPKQVDDKVQYELQTDLSVNSLLDSVLAFSPALQDASIASATGQALLHTNPAFVGQPVPQRDEWISVVNGGIRQQLRVVYGPTSLYDVRVPLFRDGRAFGEIRVGVSTLFLKNTLQPQIKRALILSGSAVLACLVLAAGLSSFTLRPLAAISRRLDLLSSGKVEPSEAPSQRSDEYGTVSTKIERLGRQMRDVKEVFSALKENLDQMMANLQDGVMLFTSDFNVVLVSASAERFIGKPRGEMLGRHPAEIFSHESRLGRAILEAFESRTSLGTEEIENDQGRHIQISLDFIEEHGERIGALLTLRDAESVHR